MVYEKLITQHGSSMKIKIKNIVKNNKHYTYRLKKNYNNKPIVKNKIIVSYCFLLLNRYIYMFFSVIIFKPFYIEV